MNEHYKAVLADLQQMKEDAEAGIRAVQRLMERIGIVPGEDQPSKSIQQKDEESVPTKIIALLEGNPSRAFTYEEIHQTLGGNEKTLRGALGRAASKGRINRAGRGKYKAKTSHKPKDEGAMSSQAAA